MDTDEEGKSISLPLQLQGHRDIAKGHEQLRKVKLFRGIFAIQQSK